MPPDGSRTSVGALSGTPFGYPQHVENLVDVEETEAGDRPRSEGAAVADASMSAIWVRTLHALDEDGVSIQQRAFLSLARLVGLLDDTALIAVPNDFTKDIVETRLRERVTECLSEELGRPVRLAVTVDPSLAEPGSATVGLDPVLRADLWAQFHTLARRGTTLLVSSHVMDEADHCGDLLLMREGRLLAHTTPARLREDTGCTSLEQAFLSVIRRTTAAPAG